MSHPARSGPPRGPQSEGSIPTRQTLLTKLKDLDDEGSWREFFEIYWRLIYSVALKAGLTDAEAQEVVQETMIAAARKMPDFIYDPAKDSFKGWLLHLTRYRIVDQFRKRLPRAHGGGSSNEGPRTATAERMSDPLSTEFAAIWEAEWEDHLLEVALEGLKQEVKPQHYEIYHLHAIKGLPVRDVAHTLGVNVALVYLVKHRLNRLLIRRIEQLKRGEK